MNLHPFLYKDITRVGDLDREPQIKQCYYCQIRPAEELATAEVAMCGNVTHSYRRIGYERSILFVPRCQQCKKLHDKVKILQVIVGGLGAIFLSIALFSSAISSIIGGSDIGGIIFGLIMFEILGLIFWGLLHGFLISRLVYGLGMIVFVMSKRVRGELNVASFPPAQDLFERQWKVGKHPGFWKYLLHYFLAQYFPWL